MGTSTILADLSPPLLVQHTIRKQKTMSSTGSAAEEPSGSRSYRPFTKAEHIQQLNDIDKSITQLLSSAGLALHPFRLHMLHPKRPSPSAKKLSRRPPSPTSPPFRKLTSFFAGTSTV